METTKESVLKKGKRPKSATRYPKRMPTYVVAFAVQESRDDPAKKSSTHSKRSSENSASSLKSISPAESTNSTKTFTITPTEKLSHVFSKPTISEVKIDIQDDNQYGDVDKKSPQISSYIVVDNIMEDEQPEVIFNASKHIKRCKDNNKFLRKKPKKNKRIIKFKNIHFKYKNPKNSISRRLEKYYEKINAPNSEQIQNQICSDGLSKVVCKSRDLKKVLAKENLLDDSDRITFYDDRDEFDVNEYDDGSLNSSPSTTKKSFVSYTSQNTLVHKSSSSSRNEDFYSIKTANSIIQVSSEVNPYKNDVINVAVAVAFNSSKPNNQSDSSNSNEIFLHKENLTSDETFLLPYVDLTSGTPSHDTSKFIKNNNNSTILTPIILNEKDLSSVTLTGLEKKSVCSADDTFVIARTSSDFNKSSINSDFTITPNDSTMQADTLQPNLISKDEFIFDFPNRTTLSDTVKSLGFFPGMAPSTSYDGNLKPEINDVIVTENLMANFSINSKNKGDLPNDVKKKLSMNILRKPFDVEKIACLQRNVNLPNDITIKAKLKETDIGQRKACFEETITNKPSDLSEMWERLTLVLDLAVTRLEESLADKILGELKKSLEVFKQLENTPKLEIQASEIIPPVTFKEAVAKMSHKEVSVLQDFFKAEIDESLQCDLVQNQVIDQLMLKLSVEAPKPIPTSTVSLKKLNKPQIVKDYFEILKPPAVESTLIEVGRGDTVTVSTATAEFRSEQEYHGLKRLKVLFSGPMSFIRENMFVITSVPTFFIVLLCLYGIIVIIMKPW